MTVCKKWIHKRCSGVLGDLSRVADGFMCRRCDGTIQEADLAEDLMVDEKTLESEWMDEVLRAFAISDIQSSPLEMKGRVYDSCVRSSMTFGSEPMPLLVDVRLQIERAEMQMIRWMCGISMKDKSRIEKACWS